VPCTSVKATRSGFLYDHVVTEGDSSDRARLAAAGFEAAYQVAVRAISDISDPDAAFSASSEISDLLRKMRDEVGEIRTRIVGEIWRREELSLAKLAERIGVSKTRAAELAQTVRLREAREQQKNEGGGE
jgi:hypothetical protein